MIFRGVLIFHCKICLDREEDHEMLYKTTRRHDYAIEISPVEFGETQ